MDAVPVIDLVGVQALELSTGQLYVATQGQVQVFGRPDLQLERSMKLGVSRFALCEPANLIGILSGPKCHIYSQDLRKSVFTFDSGSATDVAASDHIMAVASKKRIRWVKTRTSKLETSTLPIAGVKAIACVGFTIYCCLSDKLLAVDTGGQVVRQVIGFPPNWRLKQFSMSVMDQKKVLLVADKYAWIIDGLKYDPFTLESPPHCVGALGHFWLGASNKLTLYEGGKSLGSIDLDVTVLCEGFAATSQKVYQLNTQVTPELILKLAEKSPADALRLAKGMQSDDINKLRRQQAEVALENQEFDTAIELFSDSCAKASVVVSKFRPTLDNLPAPAHDTSPVASAASSISSIRIKVPALEALIPYLNGVRRRINIELAKDLIDGATAVSELMQVDTALFRSYYLSRSSLIGALVRNKNHCDTDTVVSTLSQLEKWTDLVGFLKSRHLHERALQLLQDHGSPQDIVRYLESLDSSTSFPLIKKFASLPLKDQPQLAKSLFVDTQYDPHEVYIFLSSIGNDYALEFLKSRLETVQELHNDLAQYYLEHRMIDDLDAFLQDSKSYNPHVLLPKVSTKLFHARAIVLSRLGRHMDVIDLLVDKHDFEHAKEYCTTLGEEKVEVLQYLYQLIEKRHPNELTSLLNSLGHLLDPKSILANVPDELEMKDLATYFTNLDSHMRNLESSTSLSSALGATHVAQTTFELVHLRDSRIEVSNTTTCEYCKKRLGVSVLGVWKGAVVHYGCMEAYQKYLLINS